jgi:hypothetical protein
MIEYCGFGKELLRNGFGGHGRRFSLMPVDAVDWWSEGSEAGMTYRRAIQERVIRQINA